MICKHGTIIPMMNRPILPDSIWEKWKPYVTCPGCNKEATKTRIIQGIENALVLMDIPNFMPKNIYPLLHRLGYKAPELKYDQVKAFLRYKLYQ